VRILAPFRVRDFALYWIGRTISYVGDGVMVVALPWQVYELTDSPAAMGLVGAIQTASIFAFVLLGGVAADRFERKKIIIVADVVRGVAAGAVGLLALAGSVELWHLGILVVVFGIAQGMAGPAFGSILPQLVPADLLMQANSAIYTVHPLTYRFVGPALGGIVIAAAGTGAAFLVDAASFLVGAVAIALLAARPAARLLEADERRTVAQDIREGFAYVRGRPWLWGTLTWMLVVFPLTTAPYVVLLPFLIKNELGADSQSLGLVFAAGGVGAILMSLVLSQVALPRRHTLFMFAAFTFATLDVIAYSLIQAPWQAMVVAFVAECALAVGTLIWTTLLQRAVPGEMLGRVRSLDWLAAFGLTPVGYVAVGQAAEAVGVRPVMAACGLVGIVLTAGVLLIPGIRQTEGKISLSRV
jgi:DHA3 family tetracycline resistance protein-like MFS transporter